ncbi:MAG TPA: hypothetical protein VGD88_12960 [Opitutaceae bacterium]
MTPRRFLPSLAAGVLALAGHGLLAQSASTPSSGAGATNSSAAARANAAAANPRPTAARSAAAKAEIPDPNLFDGSDQPAEARPDKGMLAEFELPGSEQRPEAMEQSQGQQQGGGAGGEGPQGEQQGTGTGGAGGKPPDGAGDPNAKAEGIAVAELKVDENSAAQQAAPPPKPRDVSMGDQSMKIPVAVAQQSVIGSQQQAGAGQQNASNSQQYEKGAAAGKSSGNNQNKGLEKGRAIPEGL